MHARQTTADRLAEAAEVLCDRVDCLSFSRPVTHVYNPLRYAWDAHESYLRRFGDSRKRVVFIGMNPGPFGMTQTGVPFGEVAAVRDWMGISMPVGKPPLEHPKRPVQGFDCLKSEVSGRRLWGLFAERFGPAEEFFREHFVLNYCPLVWMSETGANQTPDKLAASEMAAVEEACLDHLAESIRELDPEWLIGVGGYAEGRLKEAAGRIGSKARLGRVLHPSPASPAANRGWAEAATKQLLAQGVWDPA